MKKGEREGEPTNAGEATYTHAAHTQWSSLWIAVHFLDTFRRTRNGFSLRRKYSWKSHFFIL